MKKLLLIGLVLGMLTISSFIGKEPLTAHAEKKTVAKMVAVAMPGPDCRVAFERKCYYGNPLVVLEGEILDALDTIRFCASHPISCSPTECSGRLNVLYGFLPGSPKVDSCLPAGIRGK